MKLLLVVVTAVLLSCSTQQVAKDSQNECDVEYLRVINKINSSETMTDAEKQKYLPPLEEALQLCREGKTKEAAQIKDSLLSDRVFQELDRN